MSISDLFPQTRTLGKECTKVFNLSFEMIKIISLKQYILVNFVYLPKSHQHGSLYTPRMIKLHEIPFLRLQIFNKV